MPRSRPEEPPKRVCDKFGVPALGWLVLRASRLTVTDRRSAILEGAALGYTDEQMADMLGGSPNAVNLAAIAVVGQLRAMNRGHAVRIAREAGLIDVAPIEFSDEEITGVQEWLAPYKVTAFRHAANGHTYAQAADLMGISSERTVSKYGSEMYQRLGVHSLAAAIPVAYEVGILQPLSAAQLQLFEHYFPEQ